MRNFYEYFSSIILFPFYIISYLIRRQKNIWIFGAWLGFRFSDNSRYLFEHVLNNEPAIRPIWLARDKRIIKEVREIGGEAYLVNSYKGIWYSFRAGITFVNHGLPDVNSIGIFGSQKIQLWHASPMKKIGLDMQQTRIGVRGIKKYLEQLKKFNFCYYWIKKKNKWDIIIASSELAQKSWASAFGVPITKVKITGDPRGDIILSKKPKLDKYIQEIINKIKAKRIICYAPTFREGEYNFFENLNYVELDRILCEFEAILLINNHFIYGNENEDISNKLVSQRIFILDNNIFNDINKLLPFVDILITDYSSVFLDYLLLNRPMIFTPFDYDLYLKDRGFYVDYFEMTPGFKCRDWNEALKELEIILNGNDEFLDKRNEIRSIYYKFIDTNNSIRVIEQAKILLNE